MFEVLFFIIHIHFFFLFLIDDIIVDVDESIRNENVSGTKRRRVDDENVCILTLLNQLNYFTFNLN